MIHTNTTFVFPETFDLNRFLLILIILGLILFLCGYVISHVFQHVNSQMFFDYKTFATVVTCEDILTMHICSMNIVVIRFSKFCIKHIA